MTPRDRLLLGWLALTSLIAFLLFGYDKMRARQPGRSRVSEFHLVMAGALGGWLGGLAGMWLFRHKASKLTFQIKYAVAFLIWAGALYLYWKNR